MRKTLTIAGVCLAALWVGYPRVTLYERL